MALGASPRALGWPLGGGLLIHIQGLNWAPGDIIFVDFAAGNNLSERTAGLPKAVDIFHTVSHAGQTPFRPIRIL